MFMQMGDAGELLKEGSSGDDVRLVQKLLTERGFDTRGIDGIFGKNTAQAVRSFQGNVGLSIDGIVGGQTWGALLNAGPGAQPAPPHPEPGLVAPIAGPVPMPSVKGRKLDMPILLLGLFVGGVVLMKGMKGGTKTRRRRR